MGPVPIALDLAATDRLAPELADTDRLGPVDLHQQAVFNVEVDRRDGVRGRDEDERHPIAHLALSSEHAGLELIEHRVHQFGIDRILFDVEQGEPGVGVAQVANDIAWLGQGTPWRAALRNQERLSGRVANHRTTRQAVGEIGDRLEGEPVIVLEAVDERRRSLREQTPPGKLFDGRGLLLCGTFWQRSPTRGSAESWTLRQRPTLPILRQWSGAAH